MSNFIEGTNFMCSQFTAKANFVPTATDFNRYRYIKISEIVDMTVADISNLTIKSIIKEKIEDEKGVIK